jgi:hypothetical protein
MKNGIPEATHDLTRSEAIEHQLSNKFIAKFCACHVNFVSPLNSLLAQPLQPEGQVAKKRATHRTIKRATASSHGFCVTIL